MARQDDEDDDRDDEDEVGPAPKKKKGPSDEELQMAMFCHVGTLVGGFVVPLIIWMMKKDQSPYIARHGKEALNFSISIALYYLVTCGCAVFILGPFAIYWCIMAGLDAGKGEFYAYPLTIRFIK